MTTQRISRLQSLLDRIKRNAALPKQPLGRNYVLGGTAGSRSDVSAGPSVPVGQHAAAPAARTDVASHHPPLSPAAAPPRAPALAQVSVPTIASPAPGMTAIGRVGVRQRVHTMIGVAPSPAAPVPAASNPLASRPVALSPLATSPAAPVPAASSPVASSPVASTPVASSPVASSPVASSPLASSPLASSSDKHIEQLELDSDQPVLEFDDEEATHVGYRSSGSDIDNLSWSEPPVEDVTPPDSSRRERVASTVDEALIDATGDSESEIAIKTPPPESGRQPSEGVYAAATSNIQSERSLAPTAEQLGDTLELAAPTAAELELDLLESEVSHAKEELEVELPPHSSVLEPPGSDLPPDIAESDPPRRAPERSQIMAMPDEADTEEMAAMQSEPSDDTMLSNNAELLLKPEVTGRAGTAQLATIDVLHAARAFAPRSFLELLDASLKLGND